MYESFRDLQIQEQERKKKEASNQDAHTQENSTSPKRESPSLSAQKTKKKVSFASPPHDSSPESRDNQEDEVIELTEDGSFDVSSAAKPAVDVESQSSAATAEVAEPSDWVEVSRDEAIKVENDSDSAGEAVELPPPRECVKSEIRFTPRVFPTPSRESKAAEEEDWLLKNRKHINKHQGLNRTSEYDISETDRTSRSSYNEMLAE